jgi:excinuclease ABC subunit A
LVKGILYPALTKYLVGYGKSSGLHRKLEGDLDIIDQIHMVDQNPIGKSSRSNPVTYIKAWDDIRKFYAEQPRAKQLGFASKYFSFNIDAGRCEGCNGEGIINVEMQFMADVKLVCEDCKGLRFKEEVLEVVYKGKNVADILSLTVDEALEFFDDNESSLHNSIVQKLGYLKEVGMGYIHLGQPSSTLSGGEAQRVKLASFLAPKKAPYSKGWTSGHEAEHNLFIFDEPTTGLHFHDIGKLMNAFNALLDKGNTIVVVEHNVEVIKNADWVIDLGPEGGEDGGFLVAQGTPEEIAKETTSYTGKFLAEKL